MRVTWDDGSYLSRSSKKPGESSPLTREEGTNRLGHVTLRPLDDGEAASLTEFEPYNDTPDAKTETPSVAGEVLGQVLSALILAGVERAEPHVKKWWSDSARPTMKSNAVSVRTRLAKVRKTGRQAPADEAATSADIELAHPSTASDLVVDVDRATMSSEEARQRLVAALMAKALSDQAKAFSDEQLQILLNAEIDDVAALKDSLANLTPHEVEAHLNLMLEANPAFIHEFEKLFWSSIAGQDVPLTAAEARQELPPPVRRG
jgi:hypothetical protein